MADPIYPLIKAHSELISAIQPTNDEPPNRASPPPMPAELPPPIATIFDSLIQIIPTDDDLLSMEAPDPIPAAPNPPVA
jgi:hypothetical protein